MNGEIYTELEGSTPNSMAKSVGFATVEFASEFQRLKPDVVLLIGDRYEALAAALAAAYMNLCIVHLQGGEVSGSIDESARHAITKFAHFHFPATLRSREYLVRMGEADRDDSRVGCPSSDIARTLDRTLTERGRQRHRLGRDDRSLETLSAVVFHPTTTTYGGEQAADGGTARGARSRTHADRAAVAEHRRRLGSYQQGDPRVPRPERARLAAHDHQSDAGELSAGARRGSCAVGNSSSFVRDAGYFGTPVVLVGDRQEGREFDTHVLPVGARREDIGAALAYQRTHGRYAASTLYGDG